jgi:hypothetical protein
MSDPTVMSDPKLEALALALREKFNKVELRLICVDCHQPLADWEWESYHGRCHRCHKDFRERYNVAFPEDVLIRPQEKP